MAETIFVAAIEFWDILCQMAPYLLFGFFVAGVLSVLVLPEVIERHLGGRGIWPVVKAAIFGVPLPLCSCGVIPVGASLRKYGATPGATTAFLLSTPQTGVDSILVTLSLLGPVFAIFRPIAALVTGLVGGSIVNFVQLREEVGNVANIRCGDECRTGHGRHNGISRALSYGFVTLPSEIGRALFVGLVIAGVISAVVPDDFFVEALGTGIGAMVVMMAVGIPVYVCATASVPIAAALIAKGMSPGAALVFLMTGPATNAAAVTTIWKIMGRRVVVIYLGTVASMALASGIVLDYIFEVRGSPAAPSMHWILPGFVNTFSGLILLAILGFAVLRPSRAGIQFATPGEKKRISEFLITGMKCVHCVESVKRALRECAGVDLAEVDLKSGKALVSGGDYDITSLRRAVEQLGYTAVSVDNSNNSKT